MDKVRPQVVLLPDPSTEHGFRPEAEGTEDKESFVAALVALEKATNSTAHGEVAEEPSTRSGCFEVQAFMRSCGTKCYSSPNQAMRLQTKLTCILRPHSGDRRWSLVPGA